MRNRQVAGLALAAITLVVLVAALLPAWGPPALLMGGALILATWLVSRVPVPAVEIVAWGAALLLGMITVTALALLALGDGAGAGLEAYAPWWAWALFIAYEIGVATTAGGAIWHLVRHVRALRAGSQRIR